MDRRVAISWVGTLLLGGCGGGGGGGPIEAAAAPAAPTPATPTAAGLSASAAGSAAVAAAPEPTTRNIAVWGDSMLPGIARAYAYLAPDRAVHNGGYPGETSMQVLAHQQEDTGHRDWVSVFWYGHNNVRIDATSAAAQVVRDMQASVRLLAPGNTHFVVLSVVNNADDGRAGSQQYEVVRNINNQLAALFPNNFLDIRAFMVAQNEPGSPDREADVPAASLREPGDPIHLSGRGSEIVGRRVLEFVASKGW